MFVFFIKMEWINLTTKNTDMKNGVKKRRFYHNLIESYKVGRRSYSMLPWFLLGTFILTLAIFVGVGLLINYPYYMLFLGILTAILLTLIVMSSIVRKAMYSQIDGHLGAVSAIISQVKRGWIIEKQPVAFTKNQEIVWRMVGRSGVILISEGAPSRAKQLLEEEAKKYRRVIPNVTIHMLQAGNEQGQIPLSKLLSKIRKLKGSPKLTVNEVPAVAKRLSALQLNKGMPIPKGVDPMRMKNMKRPIR